ncbi:MULTISPECIES: glutathione peroxidase [Hyphomicrobium]|jgi:glutathione peroxidase|uniref:glutathione peroxidase n=1 Tax=Hyphomicrobium TaxID=81 RepID=UPI0003747742|nr:MULTISPECIES: glutathione peroxidase [Hyphomicrobium]WBT39910.1 glutathione peroxidase [Hyphomicrobium sp. DMF-1]HML43270.1 glutathione peroxidase [Hyphomicrobium zavarzinii]
MPSKLATFAAVLGLTSSVLAADGLAGDGGGAARTAWDFSFTSIDGKPMPLSDFRGQVLLVVNTASFCGFTKQYKALQELHQKYAPQGFAVIGVPSNDFGAQEPKAAGEIKEFCEGMFGVEFPLTDKNVVSGDGAHPFYKWARDELGWMNAPKWNFHKYLVGRDGKLVTSFFSMTTPDADRLVSAVEAELKKPKVAAAAQ